MGDGAGWTWATAIVVHLHVLGLVSAGGGSEAGVAGVMALSEGVSLAARARAALA